MDYHEFSNPAVLKERLASRLRELEAEIDALGSEMRQVREDLMVTEHFLHVWHRTTNAVGPMTPNLIRLPFEDHNQRLRPKNPSRDHVVEMSLMLIHNEGRPLNRQQLYDGLMAHGVNVYGKDPQMVLSTMLWRSQDRIVRLRDWGYWPKQEAFPPAGYMPEIDAIMRIASSEPEGELEEPDDAG